MTLKRRLIPCAGFGWIKGWQANGWKRKDGGTVANVEMIRYMDALKRLRLVQGWEFDIQHVKGHATSKGNIAADRLANEGCLLPLDKTEPTWSELRAEIEARIDQITRPKGTHTSGTADDFTVPFRVNLRSML